MSLVEIIFSIIRDIVVIAAVLAGFGKWKKKLILEADISKKKMEWEADFSKEKLKWEVNSSVANDLMRFTYLLRDEIREFGRPYIRKKELPDNHKDFRKNLRKLSGEEISEVLEYVYYSNRLKALNVALRHFKNETFKAKVLWGKPIEEKTNKLRDCVDSLEDNIEPYIESFIKNKSPRLSIYGGKWFRMSMGKPFKYTSETSGGEIEAESDKVADKIKSTRFITGIDNLVEEIETEIKPFCMGIYSK